MSYKFIPTLCHKKGKERRKLKKRTTNHASYQLLCACRDVPLTLASPMLITAKNKTPLSMIFLLESRDGVYLGLPAQVAGPGSRD
jgi:hypothetical protein